MRSEQCVELRIAIIAAGLLVSQPLQAETQANVQDIVVTGRTLPEVQQEVRQYVTEVGIAAAETPAARWVVPVCPKAVGLTAASLKAQVEQQIRDVAAQAGAPVAKVKCEGNLIVVFSGDAPDLVKKIAKKQRLGSVTPIQRRELETGAMPVRWWYDLETLAADGMPEMDLISPAFQLAGRSDAGGIHNTFLSSRKQTNSRTASIVATSSTRAIRHATIVVDIARAEGRKLNSVIDFAALVGLAEIKLEATPPSSILNLFSDANSARMTSNDAAMLKGLYAMPLARTADQHRRTLITAIVNSRLSKNHEQSEK